MNVELVARTAAGQWTELVKRDSALELDAAFALLVDRQSRFVFNVAYAVLRNVHDAEDVTQETFLKLFRTGAWTRIEDERRFLARAAWRLAVAKVPSKRLVQESQTSAVPSDDSSPERAAILTERSRTIHRLMDALLEKLRRPLALSSVQELTTAEIAATMGLPEGTVRRRLMEARALVKEKLSRMEGNTHE